MLQDPLESIYEPDEEQGSRTSLTHYAKELFLQDKFALLILLSRLVCLVVLPSYCLLALPTRDIANHMSPSCHAPLHGFGLCDIDDVIE
jgi:hypothetical protein